MSSSAPGRNPPGKAPPPPSSTENRAASSSLPAGFVDDAHRAAAAAVNGVSPLEALLEQVGMGHATRTGELEKDVQELAEEAMSNIGVRREGGGPIGEGDYLYGVSSLLSHILMIQGRVNDLASLRVLFCGYANQLDAIQIRIDDCEAPGSGAGADPNQNQEERDSMKAQLQADYEKVFGDAVREMMALIPLPPPRTTGAAPM